MNKKGIRNDSIVMSLIITIYLLVDVLIQSALCLLLSYFDINYMIVFALSVVVELLATIYVCKNYNIKSGMILYILFLTSPIFIGLVAMGLHYLTGQEFLIPTILALFRNGFNFNGILMNPVVRIVLLFRIPSLVGIIYSFFTNKLQKKA